MARNTRYSAAPRTPSYRLHRPSGCGVVTLSGEDHSLGKHGTPESRAKYDRLVSEWLANGRRPLKRKPAALTVDEVLLRFASHAKTYYRSNGRSSEYDNIRYAVRPLRELYGSRPCTEMSARALKVVRQGMIESGLARTTINGRIDRIRRVFRWALEEELIPAVIVTSLDSVRPLQKERSEARETEDVEPVEWERVEATLPYLKGDQRAIVSLLWNTGMRVGEAVSMKASQIDKQTLLDRGLWIYEPPKHKTSHLGHRRTVLLDAEAQTLLEPFLKRRTSGYVFSPKASARDYARSRGKKPWTRKLLDQFGTNSVRTAVAGACRRAGVAHWHPHQLRHSAATRFEDEVDAFYAQVRLGHRRVDMTNSYVKRDLRSAACFMTGAKSDDD